MNHYERIYMSTKQLDLALSDSLAALSSYAVVKGTAFTMQEIRLEVELRQMRDHYRAICKEFEARE